MSVQSVSEGRDTRHGQYYRPVALSSPGTGDNGARLAAMLADPNWRPTREQVGDLIARAFQSGYELGYEHGRGELDTLDPGALARVANHPEFDASSFWSGYDLGVEELTALNLDALERAYAQPKFSALAVAVTEQQQTRRAEWDRAAGLARDGDHPGGPVEAW